MSTEQVCLVIAVNLLDGTFLAWPARSRSSVVGSIVLP